MEKYRAKGLALQEIFSAVDKALKNAGIETPAILPTVFSQDSDVELKLPAELEEDKARILLEQLPAAAVLSRFVPAEIRMQIMTLTAVCSNFCNFSDNEVVELVAQLLNKHRPVLTGLYAETGRLIESSVACFSDNLVLDISDTVLKNLPAAAITATDKELCELSASIAYLAAEIRAQIAWGLVSDWNCFRQDLIALGILLFYLDEKVGNAITTYADLDFEQLDERTKMLIHQPVKIMTEIQA